MTGFRAHATGRVRRRNPDQDVETTPPAAADDPQTDEPAPTPPMRFRVAPRGGRGRAAARQRARDAVDFGGDLERRRDTPNTSTVPTELAETAPAQASTGQRRSAPSESSAAQPAPAGRARPARRPTIQPPGPTTSDVEELGRG